MEYPKFLGSGGPGLQGGPGGFDQHVRSLQGTMFYVCQGSCLCGTVSNRGKVIYCYGDLVPRQGDMFSEGKDSSNRTTSRDLLAAQLGIWVFGLLALLIVLLLIRKSISSLRKHIQKVTQRLPWYHDDDDVMSNHSIATSPALHHKDTTIESMVCAEDPLDGLYTPTDPAADSPPPLALPGPPARGKAPLGSLHTLRVGRRDRKKAGDGLRGKNVTEAFRVKEKDLKRTMKCSQPGVPACLRRQGPREGGGEALWPAPADLSREIERRQASLERRTREDMREREVGARGERQGGLRELDRSDASFNVYCVKYDMQNFEMISKVNDP